MANGIFNVARGMIAYYATLPGTNDALIAVPIRASLPVDDTLLDYTSLSAVFFGGAVEQTTMGRKALTAVTVNVNNATNQKTVDAADITWVAAEGLPIAAILICYDPDITSSVDANIIPLVKLDLAVSPIGSNLVVQLNPEGFYKSA